MTKQFIQKGESIINTQTDELVNASSDESAEIITDWLNDLSDKYVEIAAFITTSLLTAGIGTTIEAEFKLIGADKIFTICVKASEYLFFGKFISSALSK